MGRACVEQLPPRQFVNHTVAENAMDDPGRRRYRELFQPLAPKHTRIFELQPGDFSDPISGRLVTQAVDGEAYEAVSYVWGDPRKRRDITVNGATLSITENLHGALTAFRRRLQPPSGGDPDSCTGPAQRRQVRRLWADAVCINQGDLSERISQVEQMASIFAGARRVLAWLGWETPASGGGGHIQDAIRFIHSFMEDPEAGLRDARILIHYHESADHARQLALFSKSDRIRFTEQTAKWRAIKLFFEIEYFHRTWIVQELGLAREAVVYTALNPANRAAAGGEVSESEDRDLKLHSINWSLVGRFVKFLDYSGASLVTHLSLLSWVAHHILMVWETNEDGTPACDFLTGMHWARILRVTDARDRVYGLLGHPMAVIDGDLVIRPDYTHTRGVVYTKLAANFIRKTRTLYVVSLVDHEEDPFVGPRDWDPQDESRMPSWVPDWHSLNRTTPLDYPIAAAEPEDSDIRIEGGMGGEGATPLPHLLVRGWVVGEIAAISPRMETTDFPMTLLSRERTKKNPFWLDRVWEVVFPADGPPGRNALATLETLSLALSLGTREKDEPVGKAGSSQTLEAHRRSFAAYVLEYHDLQRRAASEAGCNSDGGGGSSGDADDSYLPARSLFDCLPAEARAELRRRAEGVSSEEFVESMTWSAMCRVVYRTTSGLVGMGSRVTRPGDRVCRVQGSPVLMTLRLAEDPGADPGGTVAGTGTDRATPISCAYIGPTVMPARMERDVVDDVEFGERVAYFRIL